MRSTAIAMLVSLGFCCSASLDASAQQATPYNPNSIVVSPALQQMVQRSDSGPVTELSGFVGELLPDSIRVYWDRSLTRYWDIPRRDIVQHVAGNNPDDVVKIYVRSSATITFANRVPVEAAAIQRAIVDGLGHIPIEGKPLPGARPRLGICVTNAVLCIAGHATNCFATVGCALTVQE